MINQYYVHCCTSSDGQLLTLHELWSAVSDAVKLDATSTDMWKVLTQQVTTAAVWILVQCYIAANAKPCSNLPVNPFVD